MNTSEQPGTLAQRMNHTPYQAYSYSYPHKAAYRSLPQATPCACPVSWWMANGPCCRLSATLPGAIVYMPNPGSAFFLLQTIACCPYLTEPCCDVTYHRPRNDTSITRRIRR